MHSIEFHSAVLNFKLINNNKIVWYEFYNHKTKYKQNVSTDMPPEVTAIKEQARHSSNHEPTINSVRT